MNISKYGSIYSRFHGCTLFKVYADDIIVLNFNNEYWEPGLVTRLYDFHRVEMQVDHPFAKAIKVFFKTEAPASVFCKQDSWSILLGKERMIFPSVPIVKHCSKENVPVESPSSKLHLCATPYFVRNPQIVFEYLQGIARPSNNHIFSYNNAILYLDEMDFPRPGGCYFDPNVTTEDAQPLYRICILGQESVQRIVDMALAWKGRRDVLHIPFQTQDAISVPRLIPCKPIANLRFDLHTPLTTNSIQKQLSLKRPHCLIQDILNSYYRHLRRQYEDSESDFDPLHQLQSLGLVVEWPFRISFEGLPRSPSEDQIFVSFAVNGHCPNRVLEIRQPYERYVEYQDVPSTIWIPITYTPDVLETPPDVSKVSIDSTVIGFYALNTFFCFSRAVLEGNVSKQSQTNVQHLFKVATPTTLNDERIQVIETFHYDSKHLLLHVHFKGVGVDAYCLCKSIDDTSNFHPKYMQLPWLVSKWLKFYAEESQSSCSFVNVNLVRLALVLAVHKICFKTIISTKQPHETHEMIVNEDGIEFYVNRDVANFINNARLEVEDFSLDEVKESSCRIL